MRMTPPLQPRARRPWLLPLLLAFFITVPIVEVWLIVSVGRSIGALPTIAILFAEAVLGAWLMRREGAKAWRALNSAYNSGRMPTGELADAALVLVGGVLLILPGFFTDVLGLICLLPFTRPLARALLALAIAKQAARAGVDLDLLRARADGGTIIQGETVPDEPGPAKPKGQQSPDDPTVIKGEIAP
jgi:UPF0716 protein FxsA